MKLLKRIKTLISKSKTATVETNIISEKQCPHCANRGMYVFNNNSKSITNAGKSNEKSK